MHLFIKYRVKLFDNGFNNENEGDEDYFWHKVWAMASVFLIGDQYAYEFLVKYIQDDEQDQSDDNSSLVGNINSMNSLLTNFLFVLN